jgi:hypothetical protein
MSSRRTRSEASVSLFPFLAVLVCAMGALILLLLAMTQKIRLQQLAREMARAARLAEAPASSKPAPVVAPPRPIVDFEPERKRRREAWRQTLADARTERDRERAGLAQRRQALADADRRLNAAQTSLAQVQGRLASAQTEKQVVDQAAKAVHDKRAAVIEQISLTQRDVSELKKRLASTSSKFELVPYDGASGTARRPIFIECIGSGFRILPERRRQSCTRR